MSAVDEYKHTSWSENCPLCVQLKARADAAIAELENEADERERIMHGQTPSGYVHYLGQLGPGDVIVGGGGGGSGTPPTGGGRGGCVDGSPRIVRDHEVK